MHLSQKENPYVCGHSMILTENRNYKSHDLREDIN